MTHRIFIFGASFLMSFVLADAAWACSCVQSLTIDIVVERTQKVDDLERVEGNSNYRGGTINGLNCVTWSDQGAACMLIGDRPIEDLCALADGIR